MREITLTIAAAMLSGASGCVPERAVQVGPISMPAGLVTIEPGASLVNMEPETVKIVIEPGAIQIQAPIKAEPPEIPEKPLNRIATWSGIALVASVLGYWGNRAIRLSLNRLRRPRSVMGKPDGG